MIFTTRGETVAMGVKAHVLFSKLLKGEDYYTLLGSDTIAGIADFLKSSESYRDPLETLPAARVHRIDLESAVRNSIMEDAASFIYYLNGARRAVFDDWLDWYDTENLKSVFRWIRSRRLDREQMRHRLYPVPGSKVPYDLLLNSRDFNEAFEALRETKYYKPIAAPIKRLEEGEESLFSLELALDNFNETSLYRNMRKLDPAELALLLPLFGARVDLLNIYILFRCLLYYGMTIEEALSRTLPVKFKIKTHHLRALSRGATWQERLDALKEISPLYAKVFNEAMEQPDFELYLEMSINRLIYLKAMTIFHTGPPGFHTAMAYFQLKSYEVNDVIRMIENVRYDYDRRSAALYLIRPIQAMGGEPVWR